ncbi:hypothetical protein PSD17_66600 [Pseudonocardia sp. D17]|nr:hypothetical protein PSD17_66600 [Pseudonocardia sp. D17]
MNERELLVRGIRAALARIPGDERTRASRLHVGPGALRSWQEGRALPNSADLEYLALVSGMTVQEIERGGPEE